jgi:hypothetical protein
LLSEPQFASGVQKFTANLSTGESVFVTAPLYPQFKYGDKIYISGHIRILHQSGGFQPCGLEAQLYEISNQIIKLLTSKRNYTMYFLKIEAANSSADGLAIASFLRQSVFELYNKALSPDLSSLLLGIVFEIKGQCQKNL